MFNVDCWRLHWIQFPGYWAPSSFFPSSPTAWWTRSTGDDDDTDEEDNYNNDGVDGEDVNVVDAAQGPVQQAGETSNGFNSAAALGRHGGHASSVVVHNLARA